MAWSTGINIKGAPGAQLRVGTGAPSSSNPTQQFDSDTYLDTATGNFYARANGSWTLQINLVGATGAQGPGILLVSANPNTTPPSPTPPLGTLALTTDGTFTLYGPSKADGSYAAIGSIRGGTGATGPGLLVGSAAPGASDGQVGSTWIDKTNAFFYGAKTASGWPTQPIAIVGPSGPIGPSGAAGSVGSPGIQGPSGLSLLSGAGAPAASLGVVGQPGYIDTANSMLYPQKTGATWGTPVSLQGIPGSFNLAPCTAGPWVYSGTMNANSTATGVIPGTTTPMEFVVWRNGVIYGATVTGTIATKGTFGVYVNRYSGGSYVDVITPTQSNQTLTSTFESVGYSYTAATPITVSVGDIVSFKFVNSVTSSAVLAGIVNFGMAPS